MSETVRLEYEIKSPMERVWQALTDPATLSQWMFFETDNFQPVVGHRFQFRGKAATGWNGIVDGEILAVDELRRLAYTWVTEGPWGPHQTTVTWTLIPSDAGMTQLHFEQTGFRPEAKQEIGGAKYGWTHQLNQLKHLIAPEDDEAER